MGYTGINLGNVKMSNRSSILKLLNDCGAMSRKDIAIELGLTPATVTLSLFRPGFSVKKAKWKRSGGPAEGKF